MTRHRFACASAFVLAAVTGAGLALSTSALPVVLDLRPFLLITSAAALLLFAAGWRSTAPVRTRSAMALAAVFTAGTFAMMLWDLTLRYRTEAVSFSSEGATLHGTLYLPRSSGRHPAVILVHGSGRQPRDEYEFYARTYARRGIGALAYDKRGSGASEGNARTATFEQLAADVAQGIELLRSRADIDAQRVGIWAISEGEWVAPLAATMTDPAFLVLISPAAMTPSQQVQYETGANVLRAGFSPEEARRARTLYAQLARFQRTGANRDGLNRELELARGEPWFDAARYLEESVPEYGEVQALEWFPAWHARMDFDALPLLARISCPVLAQAGGLDPKNDGAAALARIESALAQGGNVSFTGVLYPKARHNILEWRLPLGLPPPWFAAGYLETQLRWIEQQVSHRPPR